MARRTRIPADSPTLFPLEAPPGALMAYVSSRVRPGWGEVPEEPEWVQDAMKASWTWVIADAIAAGY